MSALRLGPQLAWALPTLCLTAIVGIGLALDNPAPYASTMAVVGISLVAAVTVAARVVPWTKLAHRWQMVMPLLALVAVALMEVQTVSVMPAVVLVATVPVLWLVYEFGRVGTMLAVLSILAFQGIGYLADPSLPASGVEWAQWVMLPTVAVGLCLWSHHIATRLQRKRRILGEQSALLESTLELAHDRLLLVQAALDSVGAGIVGFDQDGEVILENSAAHELAARAGVRLNEAWTDGSQRVFREDRVTQVPADQLVVTRAKRGEEVVPQTCWFGPPEDQVAVMLSARQMFRRNGERLGAVVVGWDVTEIVEAVRVRDEFLTTVSHELRTPLTSIIGYHELISDELGPQDQGIAGMLAIAQRNAGVLLSRVVQLLQASGADGPGFLVQEVDMSTLLHDALAKHLTAAVVAGISLTTKVEAAVSAHLDPGAWEQVVDNLVSNAIKYTLTGGSVEVVLEHDRDAFALHVVDTGIGMTPIERDRAFERFYRTTAARDQAIQGLGVGLSIARQIVEAHGGDVNLVSAPGRGTSVTVRVPLRQQLANA